MLANSLSKILSMFEEMFEFGSAEMCVNLVDLEYWCESSIYMQNRLRDSRERALQSSLHGPHTLQLHCRFLIFPAQLSSRAARLAAPQLWRY